MFEIILFLLPNSLANDLIETKHLRGGIFSWADGLSLQRKVWSSLSVPKITFNSAEISFSDITKELIMGQYDINLSKIIQDMIGGLFNNTEVDNFTEEITEFVHKLQYTKVKDVIKEFSKKFTKNYDDPYNPDDDPQPKYFCDKDLYPNAYIISDMFDGELDFNCETVNNIFGQFFSYIFVIGPLVIIFIVSLIYYIVFCFGRCCCRKATKRYDPRKAEIVFFVIIVTFIVITICFSFTASAYLFKIVNYVFKKDIQTDIESICRIANPSIKDGMQKAIDELIPSISNISNQTVSVIDLSLPKLTNVLNSTSDKLVLLVSLMKDLNNYGEKSGNKIKNNENDFNNCAAVNRNPACQSGDNIQIKLFDEFTNFEETNKINNELDNSLSNISDVTNISSFIDTGKETIIDSIDGIKDSVNDLGNFSLFDKCDATEFFEFIDGIPSFIAPLIGAFLFVLPSLMLIFLIIQIIAFWTKCCCSRCCAGCCFPWFACAFCHLLIGVVASLALVCVVFANLFYDQGDDVLDTFIKEITNEERTIDFGTLDLSTVSNDVIGPFPLESIQLKKLEFIKNFLDAKLDTSLSKIVSFDQMPFNDIADMIERSLTNATHYTNLEEMIVDPIKKTINDTKSSLPDLDLSQIVNANDLQSKLESYGEVVESCYSTCQNQYDVLSKSYEEFFSEFNTKTDIYKQTRKNVDTVLDDVPQQVSKNAYDLFGGILITLGQTFASTFRLIVPLMNNFDAKWFIGAFNIIRVKFMYNLFVSVTCMSIAAHLYIIGIMAMSILLWCRRKGMAKTEAVGGDDESTSINTDSDSDSDDTSSHSSAIIPPKVKTQNQTQAKTQSTPPPSNKAAQVHSKTTFSVHKEKVSNEYSKTTLTKVGSPGKFIKKEKVSNEEAEEKTEQKTNFTENQVNPYDLSPTESDLNDNENPQILVLLSFEVVDADDNKNEPISPLNDQNMGDDFMQTIMNDTLKGNKDKLGY